jgi:fructose-bisphosphate aldolase / 2-amino-3,7-dideoxy-D-threo-hept-6-ulosonate synthase
MPTRLTGALCPALLPPGKIAYMTTSMGKTLRLARLFDQDTGTSVMLPMDHANEEPDYVQLERPIELITGLAGAGVNAFLFRRGLAAYAASAIAGRAAWVQRITGRSGLSASLRHDQLVIAAVEQALHNGADAVVPTFFIGPRTETYLLPKLGAIADECDRIGIPLLAEVFPAGGPDAVPYNGPYTVDDLRMAVRVASEEGADMIKTWYTGDPDSFSRVLDYSLVPVVVAGGPRADSERAVLEMVRGAMQAGACGVAMGRKIWQSADPVAMAKAVIAVIRHGASVDDAMRLLAGAE